MEGLSPKINNGCFEHYNRLNKGSILAEESMNEMAVIFVGDCAYHITRVMHEHSGEKP